MSIKTIGLIAIPFGLGVVAGVVLVKALGKKKEATTPESRITEPEEAPSEEEVKDTSDEDLLDKVDKINAYDSLISDLQYRDQNPDDLSADPLTEEESEELNNYLINKEHEIFKQKNWGKVVEITPEQFQGFLYSTSTEFEDFVGEDLLFFPKEDTVTDDAGRPLTVETVSLNLGDLLDSTGFREDESRDHLYVASYDVMTIFDVRKVVDKPRREYEFF